MKSSRPPTRLIHIAAASALGSDVIIEPVTEGVSTYIYRIHRGSDLFYLRVLPEVGATFAPEAAAHGILRRRGVHVPEVLYWEDRNQLIDLSIMITTEIKGTSIEHNGRQPALPKILREAGRDLALFNSVPVEGFGWIRRNAPTDEGLRADLTTERELMLSNLDHALDVLTDALGEPAQARAIRDVVGAHITVLDTLQAHLAHGDLDATHLFSHNGLYTGLIDLGEIRGTGQYYDLGHFRFHDGETLPTIMLPYLLEGYQEITPLPPDADERISLASLLIGVEFLARTHTRLADHVLRHALAAIAREVAVLTG